MRGLGMTLGVLLLSATLASQVSATQPAANIAIHVGSEYGKMSRAECARKAVAMLGGKEKFPFAEITPDGNVRGWNETTSVLVLTFPTPDKETLLVTVVAAGTDNTEAERLRNAIRDHVKNGPHDPDAPQRFAPEGKDLPRRTVCLSWKSEQRNLTNLVRFFEPVARLALEKQGFATSTHNNALVFAGHPAGMVAAFVSPTASGVSLRFNVVTATSLDDGGALAADLLTRIVRLIYE
jgi:hypothetical protein